MPSWGMRKIFVDECGYTGPNLLDEAQPFQAAAAIEVSNGEAAGLIDKYFPRHQAPELKYRQLARRESYWAGLAGIQRHLLTQFPCHSYVVDKRFMLIQKFLGDCVEPVYHSAGIDFYADGALEQAASLIYHCGPIFYGKEKLDNFLDLYQKASRTKDHKDLELLIKKSAEFSSINLGEFFGPLGLAHPLATVELMDGNTTTDIAYPLVIGLISLCEQRESDYEIIHDQSDNLKLYADSFQSMIDVGLKKTFKMSSVCQLSFPLRMKRVSQVDSKTSPAVQLADILVGGTVDFVKGSTTLRDQPNSYLEELSKIYSEAPEESFIFQFPSLDFKEISERRSGNQSNDFIDFGVTHLGESPEKKK